MKSNLHNKISPVADRANDFLRKKTDEVLRLPVEDVKMLVSDLVRSLYAVADQDRKLLDDSITTGIPYRGKISIDQYGVIVQADNNIAAMLGKDLSGLLKHPIQSFIQRSYKKRFNQHYRTVIKSGKEQDCQLILVNAEGRSLEVYLNLKPQYDHSGCFQKLETSVQLKAELNG